MTQNYARKLVQRADKQTGVRQTAVNYALAHIGKPYDLVNVPEECPNISNTCQVVIHFDIQIRLILILLQGQPCGPGRLCLPDGRGSHTCK